MRVDFYQLGPDGGADQVIASLATRLLAEDQRLLVVAKEDAQRARLDRLLWDQGATSFIPHGLSGSVDDPRQPVLISASTDAPNGARNMLIADGEWREAALHFDRTFFLFSDETIEAARTAWKTLGGRDKVERHYWARENGRWDEKA